MKLTWSSLAAAKQELDNVKDLRQTLHEMQEVNHKLTESVADSRAEVQSLTLAMKNLEMQNIQQRKWMEDIVRKMAKEMKSLENEMVEIKATHDDEETGLRRSHFYVTSVRKPKRRVVFPRELSKRDIDTESRRPESP